MPRFCSKCGLDMVICQSCGKDVCSNGCDKIHIAEQNPQWVEGKGNVCGVCQSKHCMMTQHGLIFVEPRQMWYPKPGNTAYDLMC